MPAAAIRPATEGRTLFLITLAAGDGSFGNLGNGKGPFTADSYFSNVPVEVSGGHLFDTVCAGVTHSCALEPSGKAWCWGKCTHNLPALTTGAACLATDAQMNHTRCPTHSQVMTAHLEI